RELLAETAADGDLRKSAVLVLGG
ncbi:MAG: hypothetical protein QOI83_2718, partial [Streptomycetaceae bacterium]|nr:hypothetical protein [Streptomycetaceae bacterium]